MVRPELLLILLTLLSLGCVRINDKGLEEYVPERVHDLPMPNISLPDVDITVNNKSLRAMVPNASINIETPGGESS